MGALQCLSLHHRMRPRFPGVPGSCHQVSQGPTPTLPFPLPPPPPPVLPSRAADPHVRNSPPPIPFQVFCVVCPKHVRLEIHPSKGWDRETGQQGTQLPTVALRAVTFLSSKPEWDTLCLLWIFRCRAPASPGDQPHLPCHPRSLLPLIPPAATSPGPRAPLCRPCSLCWSLRLCSPLALPIHYFSFSYKTFSKTSAWLKIKMQEVSHPPLCTSRSAGDWLP